MMKKETNQCSIFVAVIILILVIEVLGSYCNGHAEEHREKEWKRFEEWHNNIMAGNTGIRWDAR